MAASTYRDRDACSKGHAYTQATTYFVPSRPGIRYCRTCREEWSDLRTLERRAKSKTGRRMLTSQERLAAEQQAIGLRANGLTFRQIGEAMGISPTTANRLVRRTTC